LLKGEGSFVLTMKRRKTVDPWNRNDAYGTMFCDKVFIKGVRPDGDFVDGCYSACVYPPEREQPFADFDADSSVRRFTFLLQKKGLGGWGDNRPPQIGDEVTLPDCSKWKVCQVESTVDWFEMGAKSC
jgi:hypothetical protein